VSQVIVADPTAPIISISTRLRFYEDDESISSVNISILVEVSQICTWITVFQHVLQAVNIPPQTEISLSSDTGNISLLRRPVGSGDFFGVHLSVSNGYDAIVNMTIFPAEGHPFQSYSWISLQATTIQSDDDGVSKSYLLGAQNVVFNAEPTRNLRFARPTSQEETIPEARILNSTVDSGNRAVGWWFRDEIGDTNSFPRLGVLSHSPGALSTFRCRLLAYMMSSFGAVYKDIQATGQMSDPNIVADIGGSNQDVDYTDAHAFVVAEKYPNYFYLRGNCTLANDKIEARLFVVPCNVLISPSTYYRFTVNDVDEHGDVMWAKRTITTTQANGFNVFDIPFNLLDPLPPSTYGADHYCVVAETRRITASNSDPNWPHEITGDFASGKEFPPFLLFFSRFSFLKAYCHFVLSFSWEL
jgi:hypothetical protein